MTLTALTIAEREPEKGGAPHDHSFFNFFGIVANIRTHREISDILHYSPKLIVKGAKVLFYQKAKRKSASADALYTLQEKKFTCKWNVPTIEL